MVAKITAGDNILRPRVRILADEHLSGAAHDSVQTRLDLWTRSHVEHLLAPLFVLGAAEDITGLARGIAYQIVEALGVLERSKVAEDVKTLDQAARANLRKHGVRFGAFHIYVPSLLKPAPRSLAAELWALKHGGAEVKGLDDLQRLASSGRTSFAVDKDVPRALYRTIGYRVCGERAVRVDILERLADLIRPALAWRDGAATPKPPGAFDGKSFTVTQAMTSLTGSSGEDFASILRALGYRMDKRPRPAEPPPAAATSDAAPVDAAAADVVSGEAAPADTAAAPPTTDDAVMTAPAASAPEGEAAPAPVDPAEPAPSSQDLLPVPDLVPSSAEAAVETDSGPVVPEAPTDGIAAEPSAAASVAAGDSEPVAVDDAAGAADGGAAAQSEAKPKAEEPAFIEVWRPGWSDERRPRRHARGARRPAEGQAARAEAGAEAHQPAAAGEVAPAEAAATTEANDGRRRHGRPDRGDQGDRGERRDRGERSDRPRESRRPREGRPDHDRPDRGERRGDRRPGRPDRGDRRDDRREERRFFAKSDERRNSKEPDPDSPFAKLAALKAQLEANAKDR